MDCDIVAEKVENVDCSVGEIMFGDRKRRRSEGTTSVELELSGGGENWESVGVDRNCIC